MPNSRAADKTFLGGYVDEDFLKEFNEARKVDGLNMTDAMTQYILAGIAATRTKQKAVTKGKPKATP